MRTPTQRLRSRSSLLAASALGLALCGSPASAAEGGLSNFPYGAQTSYAAFVPAPGTTSFFGYALYIDGKSLRDNDGDKIPGVSIEAFALAPRLVHTWNSTFHGWKMTSGAVIEGLYVKVEVPGLEDKDTGPTLLGFEPLYLSKTFGAFTFFHGSLIYLPIGSSDKNQLANSNLNYKSLAYQGSMSWNPNARVDVALNAAVEFKDDNDETDYQSGPQASLTFGAGYKPFAGNLSWDLGISGFYTDGLADDKIDGDKVPGGGRTKKFAIGPKIVYLFSPGAAIVAQYHREMETENAAQGDLFWLECVFPL